MNITLPNELRNCPFCDGESHVIYNDLGNKEYIARCCNIFSCGSRGSAWLTKSEAVKAWNARHAAAQPVALIEALQELMAWQVKNVHCWNNSAYDNAAKVLRDCGINPASSEGGA